MNLEEIDFGADGLVPAVVTDADGGAVLMLGYVNRESLEKTIETGEVHFWSRSRQRLWRKGESSGNVLALRGISVDCDSDALLIRAEPTGPTCHTGERSCFFRDLDQAPRPSSDLGDVLGRLGRIIRERDASRPDGSYTTRLFEGGVRRIAQKLGEEAVETVIAATSEGREKLAEESADLLYHLLVLWQAAELTPSDVGEVLSRRASFARASRPKR